jgi:hypothetical protein
MRKTFFSSVLIVLGFTTLASAQQRPLVTEDPETVGEHVVLIEGGMDYQHSIEYPVSGLEGNLLRLPTLGVSFGLGASAEFQIDGGLFDHLSVTSRRRAPLSGALKFTGDSTSDFEDITVATKIRLVSEAPGRPAFGIRFATKLPTASNESGLGLDTTDFLISTLLGKTVQSVRLVGNVGVAILGEPLQATSQNESLTYGFSFARAVKQGVEIVGEINGRHEFRNGEPPPGTEDRSAMRFGVRATTGAIRFDGGLIIGLASRDPNYGFTGGLTWVFRTQ